MTTEQQETVSRTLAGRIGYLLTSWIDYLPRWLRRLVPRELAGYTIISMVTFVLDMSLLTVLVHRTHMPVSLAVSLSYAVGFSINYILNRTLNFQSRAPVPGQLVRYVNVVVVDFLLTLGMTRGLIALGLIVPLSRLISGCVIGLGTFFLYRHWVFRK